MADREQIREARKAQILVFLAKGRAFTNTVAKEIEVTWPVADRLLTEMLQDKLIGGDKEAGYTLPKPKLTFGQRISKVIRRKK